LSEFQKRFALPKRFFIYPHCAKTKVGVKYICRFLSIEQRRWIDMRSQNATPVKNELDHLAGQVCPKPDCDGTLSIKLDAGKRLKCDNVHCGAVIGSVSHWISLCRSGRPSG
jgi:hypothetical protein